MPLQSLVSFVLKITDNNMFFYLRENLVYIQQANSNDNIMNKIPIDNKVTLEVSGKKKVESPKGNKA